MTVRIINLIILAIVATPIPIEIQIKTAITPIYVAVAAVALGITLKSKGKTESNVKTVASESTFKASRIISCSVYLSKIIRIIWPIMVNANVVVRIGSHR